MRSSDLPYDIQIPEPCSANWQQMQAISSVSRRCESCRRQVHDLSGLSAREVRRLVEHTGGSFCGRVTRRADGSLLLRADPPRSSAWPGGVFVLAAALATSGMATSAESQGPPAGANAISQTADQADGPQGESAPQKQDPAQTLAGSAVRQNQQPTTPVLGGIIRPPERLTLLQGHLLAPGNLPVIDANLTFTDRNGRIRTGTTSNSGEYRMDVPPGKYIATVSLQSSDGQYWYGTEAILVREGSHTRDFLPSEPVSVTAGAPTFVDTHKLEKKH